MEITNRGCQNKSLEPVVSMNMCSRLLHKQKKTTKKKQKKNRNFANEN